MTPDHKGKLTPLDVPGLLKMNGLRPHKSLGQNFLQDDAILAGIVDQAGVTDQDTVLEIGPGLGSLTRHLARAAGRVAAVELDDRLIPPLRQVVKAYANVTIFQGDILRINLAELDLPDGYLVVANIPYYLTSALIRRLLEAEQRPARLVLTVQKEVAARITAQPGDLSLLALSVQVFGEARITGRIPAGSFYPAPSVDSAVVRVDLYPRPRLEGEQLESFFQLIKAGFSQKRKTLRNAVSATLRWAPEDTGRMLLAAGVDPQRRAETVSIEEWGKIVEEYRKAVYSR